MLTTARLYGQFVFLLALVGLFVPLLLPVWLWRTFITKSTWKPKRIGSILSPLSTLFIYMEKLNVTAKNPQVNILTDITFEGSMTIEHLRNCVTKQLLQGEGKIQFPELQQHTAKWLGFYFWEWDNSFCVDDHVIEINHPTNTTENLIDIHQMIMNEPFAEGGSPWKFYLVVDDHALDQKFHIFFKTSHQLMDGFSITRIMFTLSGQTETALPTQSFANISKSNTYISPAQLIFRIYTLTLLYEWFQILRFRLQFPGFLERSTPSASKSTYSHWISTQSAFQPLRNTAKARNVATTSFILAGISGALTKFFERRKIEISEPPVIMLTLASTFLTSGLTNSFTNLSLVLPTGKLEDEVRIRQCDKIFRESKQSVFFRIWPSFVNLMSLSFTFTKLVWKLDPLGHLQLSIFPMYAEEFVLDGRRAIDASFVGQHAFALPWIFVGTYNKKIKVSVMLSSCSTHEAKELVSDIDYEFKYLIGNNAND